MDFLRFHHNKKDLELIANLKRENEQLKSDCNICKHKLELSTEVTVERLKRGLGKRKAK